jgi:hypothetical protein
MTMIKSADLRHRRSNRLEGLTAAVLVSSSAFLAAPKIARASLDVYTATGNQSWFNSANWSGGTLPQNGDSVEIDANNAAMPSVGVLFDPANDAGTPGGISPIYDFSGAGSTYIANGSSPTGFTQGAPNKLTIESGTMELGNVTDGRDGPGVVVQNGGTLLIDQKFAIQGQSHTQTIGSGTFEYHGGTFIEGNQVQVGSANTTSTVAGTIGATSAGVGKLVVYNDGPDGAFLVSNGLTIAQNANGKGTIGIVEFHYDLNPEGVGNTRPVQDNFNTTNGQLKLDNGTNTSSRLNLVLDAAPSQTHNFSIWTGDEFVDGYTPFNLGLFKIQSLSGIGTFPRLFYALDGAHAYTQGATIAAAYSGSTYSWTISYSGMITFDNSATSAYTTSDISATGGADIVLLGLPYDVVSVPEPTSMAILGGAGSLILARRRRRKTTL